METLFQERLKELVSLVGIRRINEFARFAGCDPSYISRLRSAAAAPQIRNPATNKLVEGICACAQVKGRVEELCDCVGCTKDLTPHDLRMAVGIWLFEGGNRRHRSRSNPDSSFADRLNDVMKLAEISNARLARLCNVDASLVSRYRAGLRNAGSSRRTRDQMCRVLLERLNQMHLLGSLSRMVGVPEAWLQDPEQGLEIFTEWLCRPNDANIALLDELLQGLENFSVGPEMAPLKVENALSPEILAEQASSYYGTKGLQRAVLRFLGGAVRRSQPLLLLYSDQDMGWMVDDRDFALRWMSLMAACVRNGTRIRIIHNVNRDLGEMVSAIRSWMPLYMSGRIESYYSARFNGQRFSHTFFIAPGAEAISCQTPAVLIREAEYHYDTDMRAVAAKERVFQALMEDCSPLVQMQAGVQSMLRPALGKGGSFRVIQNGLSLGTMPETLLQRILARATLPEEQAALLREQWTWESESYRMALDQGAVQEFLSLPSDEMLFGGKARVPSAVAELYYTPEEFAIHASAVRQLLKNESYQLIVLPQAPYENLRILLSDSSVMVEHHAPPMIAFSMVHSLMRNAFAGYMDQLWESYHADQASASAQLQAYT